MNNKAAMLGLAVLAFLVAAVLVIMIFRMLFSGRLRMPGGRARQARLGIVDAFDLDRQRQLIIVRRDNTEHLIMIGGPNDVVIESEIVRAESREVRDQRREQASGDVRIPAPAPAFEKASGEKVALGRSSDEPRLTLPPIPEPRPDAGSVEAQRTPTFPLPPRRPVSTPTPPPAMERRPQPTPPKLPESVSRGDDMPVFSGQPAAPAPPAPVVPPPMASPRPSAPLSSGMPSSASQSAAPPPPAQSSGSGSGSARPPFLKPLPPRPPVRPLPRPAAPAPSAGAPGNPSPRPTSTGSGRPEGGDALESLEEEMAKLLGRGS